MDDIRYYLGLIFLLTQNVFATSIPSIKVLIAKDRSIVNIKGTDVKRVIWTKKSNRLYEGEKKFRFNCKSQKIGKNRKPFKLASLLSKTGMLKHGENRYRGTLHVLAAQDHKGCDIVNELSLEEYLESLLSKEMHNSWPQEALKAQAVAARSYAYYKLKTKQVSKTKGFDTFYDLENSEKHQVNGTFFDVTKSTSKATRETRGELLFLNSGKITPVFFHSKCGGKTLTPGQVWTNEISDYSSVDCPFCHKHGTKAWNKKIKLSELTAGLTKALYKYKGVSVAKNDGLTRLIKDSKNDSHIKFYLGDEFHVIKKSRLRGTLGRKVLPSNLYKLSSMKNKNIAIKGAGFGHGVGLCQFGAKELAKRGYNYKQILNHYFPKLILKKLY